VPEDGFSRSYQDLGPDRRSPVATEAPTRIDGFAALADYACLGDGRTVALVARDGGIDWWPQPRLADPPLVSALLDPENGGRLTLAPVDAYTVRRRYLPGTNVLATEYATASGSVRVTDALNTGEAGRLPWCELVRRVDGLTGTVEMSWSFEPSDRFGVAMGWSEISPLGPVVHLGDQLVGIRLDAAGDPELTLRGIGARFDAVAGRRTIVAFVASDDEPLFMPAPSDIDIRLDRTIDRWESWCRQFHWDGDHRELVLRSALALKLITDSDSGAIAAAATTSLPERLGGDKNYDYRYAWIRDLSFSVDALLACGLHEEVHHAMSWLLATIRRNEPGLKPFYSLAGDLDMTRMELPLAGYRGSRPVVSGNAAVDQCQLGMYGDLFHTLWQCFQGGHALGAAAGQLVAQLADACCDDWRRDDAGIWEVPEERAYTVSKIGCWVALDRACALADAGEVPAWHLPRWEAERDAIRAWVEEHCWSRELRSYTMAAGSSDLDASVLLMARMGFDRGDRLASTVEAIRRDLAPGPGSSLLYRYTGMQAEEGAFLACSFWLVEAEAHLGHDQAARTLFQDAASWSTDVGLFTEQADPDGSLLGNLPQALTHLSLINAAALLDGIEPTG
jgi:GH15 family glucan-1,4-alpha-glucosidase